MECVTENEEDFRWNGNVNQVEIICRSQSTVLMNEIYVYNKGNVTSDCNDTK